MESDKAHAVLPFMALTGSVAAERIKLQWLKLRGGDRGSRAGIKTVIVYIYEILCLKGISALWGNEGVGILYIGKLML